MIALLGETTLGLALLFAFLQSALPLWGYYQRNPYLLAFARPAAIAQCSLLIISFGLLTTAFTISDFSIAYVAANSHPHLPLMYRLTATWGGHEGSILLWTVMLSLWSTIFAFVQKNKLNLAVTLGILGTLSFAFLGFILLTSNPFLQTTEILSGNDLNPLLQDPGFVIHPPMLYAGYVGFSVAFAMTLAGLIGKQLDTRWAHFTRRFALAAWCFLTLGILLGSWWAYRVLGWGGFWFWDPVENASLLPWLSGTALIHILILVEKRNVVKGWAAFLALVCFALSLLGTFLVRSGVLISVHTFATDPKRGLYLLALLAVLITVALVVYLIQLPKILNPSTQTESLTNRLLSRSLSLLLNSGLLFVSMLTILLGTLYPLMLDALHLGAISVGAPYFNTVMMPLVFIIMTAMGFASFSRWQPPSFKQRSKQIRNKLLLSMGLALTLTLYFTHTIEIMSLMTFTLSGWIILSIFPAWRLLPAMSFAHIGFAMMIVGIMLSSLLSQEIETRMQPGEATNLGPYQFIFADAKEINGSNFRGIQADFEIVKSTRLITHLYPEKRIYTVRDTVMSKVDIHPGLFRDLYIALGEPLAGEYWSVRIYYKPFIRWIWLGGLLMMIGGLIAIGKKTCRPR